MILWRWLSLSSCVLLRCRRDNEMNDGPVRQWRSGLVCDLNDLCIEPVTKIKGGWADCQPVHDLGFSPKVRISEPQARCRSRLQSNPCHLRFIDCPMFHAPLRLLPCFGYFLFWAGSVGQPDASARFSARTVIQLQWISSRSQRRSQGFTFDDVWRMKVASSVQMRVAYDAEHSADQPATRDQDCRNANAACRIILRPWLVKRCCDDEHSVNPAKRVRNRAEDLAQYSIERLS